MRSLLQSGVDICTACARSCKEKGGASRLTHWSAAAQTCCALGCQCPPRLHVPHICPRPAVLLRQCTAVLHSESPSPVLAASLLPAVAATSNMRSLTGCPHWFNTHLQRLLPMLPLAQATSDNARQNTHIHQVHSPCSDFQLT